jgi:hypothetical protein
MRLDPKLGAAVAGLGIRGLEDDRIVLCVGRAALGIWRA